METGRILFICPSYPAIGGVETVTSMLVDYFISKEYVVFILVSCDRRAEEVASHKHSGLIYLMKGVLNSDFNISYIQDFIINNDIKYVFNQGVFSEFRKRSWQKNDLILINTLHSCPFWEVEKFGHSSFLSLFKTEKTVFKKLKLIIRYPLYKINPYLAFPNIFRNYRLAIEESDYYVVLNQSYKRILENKLFKGKSIEKIKVIPNPSNAGERILVFEKEKIILYAGRLVKVPKRVDRLLSIWKIIEDKLKDWNLIILGDGEEKPNLEKISKEMNLKRITFEGYKPAYDYYRKAAIICLTSDYEGAPLVITEAQSYGVVPISFDSSAGIRDMIQDGVDGIIVKQGDVDMFSGELLKLASDNALRESISKKCIDKSLKNDLEKIGISWTELFKKSD